MSYPWPVGSRCPKSGP